MTNVLEYRGRIQTLREGKKTYVLREAVEVNNWLQSVPELRVGEEKKWIAMDNFRVAFTRFVAFYSDNRLLDFAMTKHRRSGKVRQVSPLTPRPNLNGRQNF